MDYIRVNCGKRRVKNGGLNEGIYHKIKKAFSRS